MKKIMLLCFSIFLCVLSFSVAKAADINNGLNDQVVVSGFPEITGEAVDGHIRIIEFILGTRMTLKQKEVFFEAIKNETASMEQEERENFIEVIELVKSLNLLDEADQESVRAMLEKEYVAGSIDLKDDPAARQFLMLQNDSQRPVVIQGTFNVTRQAIEAFAEYLAFISRPDNPIWPNEKAIDMIETRVKIAFASLEEEERLALESFHYSWYLMRASWQHTKDVNTKNSWKSDFASVGLRPGNIPDVKQIKKALSTDVYADMLDMATNNGIEPIEWSSDTKVRVW